LICVVVASSDEKGITIWRDLRATLIERARRYEGDRRRLRLRELLYSLRCSRWSVSLQGSGKFTDLRGAARTEDGCGQDRCDDGFGIHVVAFAAII